MAVRTENRKRERVIRQISEFGTDSQGLMTFRGWIWVPYTGGARRILMEEVEILDPSRGHKDVFGFEEGLLASLQEERCGMGS